ncbi:MAG: hypothetical protein ABS36_18840 [Acidobacteria bacterium SCN 69-37]|nr:MAG: hypothetical protein ABS36_18840 [Acidobacteria bacterium SCN 69-37]
MTLPLNRFPGLVVAAVGACGLAWLSQIPIASDRASDAVLRLTWRARPERIEHCVTQSPEALAALPPHMRQTTICEGINASYRLVVQHNGVVVADQVVAPGGLRRDRPLYVFREITLPPADDAAIVVTFTRVEAGSGDAEPGQSDRDTMRESVPASLTWERHLRFAPGQVRIVSYDPERRALFEVVPG